MNRIKKLITLAAFFTLFSNQVKGEESNQVPVESSSAYYDSEKASYLSAALPIGALAVAAIIIATTDNHHHSRSSNNENSSSSHHHGNSHHHGSYYVSKRSSSYGFNSYGHFSH